MTTDREQRKTIEVTQHVADEGNVPGKPSTPGILAIVAIVLIGTALIYLASASAPSNRPNPPSQSSPK
jgi:hypothetical protein